MADQEIARHTKQVIRVASDGEIVFLHKVREIAVEIVTIVFAVSISIWFHSLSEHRHEQKQVQSFLVGLRGDLKDDIKQLQEIAASDRALDANYKYLASLEPGKAPDVDKFEPASALADSNIWFIPSQSRYDGFKSSGKLTNIENEELLNDIQELYQSLLPQIRNSERGALSQQERWRAYMEQRFDVGDDLAHRYQLVVAPKGKRVLQHMQKFEQLYTRYQNYATLAAKIVKTIEHSYPEQH